MQKEQSSYYTLVSDLTDKNDSLSSALWQVSSAFASLCRGRLFIYQPRRNAHCHDPDCRSQILTELLITVTRAEHVLRLKCLPWAASQSSCLLSLHPFDFPSGAGNNVRSGHADMNLDMLTNTYTRGDEMTIWRSGLCEQNLELLNYM